MGILTSLFGMLPLYLLSLPVMLMALSVHESAHGYAAYRLGDPTARSLGRITLNPVKHFDLFGFLSMLIFHIGWAKPVPINARYFKKPRRDMAITGAAGPISNLCLAIIHLLILRIAMIFVTKQFYGETVEFALAFSPNSGEKITLSMGYTVVALILYLLHLGVSLNIMLAIFNLIPIPPFDGSRIFYAFLPPKWYWGIMKYEQFIMIGFIVVFFLLNRLGLNPLGAVEEFAEELLFTVTGMGEGTAEYGILAWMQIYVQQLLIP